eukprot:4255451-Karenia_brevis.AAC.1
MLSCHDGDDDDDDDDDGDGADDADDDVCCVEPGYEPTRRVRYQASFPQPSTAVCYKAAVHGYSSSSLS